MTSKTIDIRLEDNKNNTELFLDNKLYTVQRNEADCFAFLLKDYFFDLIKEINLKNLYKIDFFDSNYRYYKEYREGFNLYLASDISYNDLQSVFKAIGYNLKYIYTTNAVTQYELICKRKLIEVNSFMSPALWYSNKEESWYIIAGSDVHIKVSREINLCFDLLWIPIKLKITYIPVNNDWKSAEYTTDEDSEEEDIRIRLF